MNWRNSREYRIWRATVIRRDVRCVVCGSIQNREAHHIKHATYNVEDRYDPNNGICLCNGDHNDFHNLLIGGTKKNCDFNDLERYIKLNKKIKERNII